MTLRRLRVMQIVTGVAIGDQSGGAEQFAVQLARHLPRHEFEPAVFAMWRYGSPAEEQWLTVLRSEGIPVHGLLTPSGSLPVDLVRALRSFWSQVGEFRPIVINSHSERGDAFGALARLAHPVHPRAVRTVHATERWQRRRRIGAILEEMVFPLAFDAEVAVSQAVSDLLTGGRIGAQRRRAPVLCYNGIDGALFCEPTPASPMLPPGVPDAGPRLGIIGRLADEKGHADLLWAMRLVCARRPAHLLVVGSGQLENQLCRLAQNLGIADYVHFLGSRADVAAIMRSLDLVVCASLREAFPTVVLEAMAAGVPVVATDVAGNRELVRPGITGLLAPAGNPEQLAAAILEALADPDRGRSMAGDAKRWASRYTIQAAALRYAEIYQRTATGRGTAGEISPSREH